MYNICNVLGLIWALMCDKERTQEIIPNNRIKHNLTKRRNHVPMIRKGCMFFLKSYVKFAV